MRSFDYVIIGFGIAGLAMARELGKRDQYCLVLDAGNQTATRVAGEPTCRCARSIPQSLEGSCFGITPRNGIRRWVVI